MVVNVFSSGMVKTLPVDSGTITKYTFNIIETYYIYKYNTISYKFNDCIIYVYRKYRSIRNGTDLYKT